MKRLFPFCLAAWLVAAVCRAGPTEAAIIALMRLSDQPNYSWVATVSDDARTYDIVGRTTRSGYTHVKMPVINSVRRQLGRSATDTEIDFIFRGNVECVIETDDGWKKPGELPRADEGESMLSPLPGANTASLRGPLVTRRTVRGSIVRRPTPGDDGAPAYSNLQLAISHPHEDLAVIVSSHHEFTVTNDVISGALTELGAQLLLVRDGQENIAPVRAAGTFKVWLRDGNVTKFQVTLEGTLSVTLPSGRRLVEVRQVTDTIVKDVGRTHFEVPAAAREKLGT